MTKLSWGQDYYYVVAKQDTLFQTTDSLSASDYVREYIQLRQMEGYFEAEYNYDREATYFIESGERYKLVRLSRGNLPEEFLGNFSFEQKFQTGQPFSYQQLWKLKRRIIEKAENSGYPFASIGLDTIKIKKREVFGVLGWEPGPYITFDSIKITGTAKINKKWLEAYLGIKQGNPYSQKTVDQLAKRLEMLSFVKLGSPPAVSFQHEEALISLNLIQRKADQLDVMVGFGSGTDNNLLITGNADIQLYNLFRSGHQLLFNWKRLRSQTQELDLSYTLPNILRTPISVSGSISLFRQDVSFFNRELMLGFSYLSGASRVGVFTNDFRSVKIDDESETVKDIGITYGGITIDVNKLNDFIRPTKGWMLNSSFAIGEKQIEDQLASNKSIQLNLRGQFSLFNPIGENYLLSRISLHSLLNDQLLFNDLLRVGGIENLRGFPEGNFYVSESYLLSNEYHLLFNNESSFFGLIDVGLLKSIDYDIVYSGGLGFDLKLNNSIFELIYAIGIIDGQAISFDRSVLHIGYKSVF